MRLSSVSCARASEQLSFEQRLESIAQRLEAPAWICLLGAVGYVGFLIISM
jgi:hypothetical protein